MANVRAAWGRMPVTDVVLVALVTATATLIASFGTIALSHRQERRREDRRELEAREERVRTLRERRIEATRRAIDSQIEMFAAYAIGDLEGSLKARRTYDLVQLDAEVALLGRSEVVEAYHGLLVALRERYGIGLEREHQVLIARVRSQLDTALLSQLERVLRGDAVLTIPEDQRASLFEAEAFAQRLRVPRQPPTISGRLARVLLERQVPKP